MSILYVKLCFLDTAEGWLLFPHPFCRSVSFYWESGVLMLRDIHESYLLISVILLLLLLWWWWWCVSCPLSWFAGLVLIIPCDCLLELVTRIKQGAGEGRLEGKTHVIHWRWGYGGKEAAGMVCYKAGNKDWEAGFVGGEKSEDLKLAYWLSGHSDCRYFHYFSWFYCIVLLGSTFRNLLWWENILLFPVSSIFNIFDICKICI